MHDDSPTAHPVVMLHGFAQTSRCLGPLAGLLGEHHEVRAVDLPGHGNAAALAHLDCRAISDHLAALCGPAHWIGYSFGGRIALGVALVAPDAVRSLVLIGATAGIADPTSREYRRLLDHQRASEIEDFGVGEFTRRWLQMDMFAGLPDDAHFTHERLTNTVSGLAASLRNAGTGSMEPQWDRLHELNMPVLLITGERDTAFTDTAMRMAAAIGDNATAVAVPDAGHAAHLEAPETTFKLIHDHLRNLNARR